MPKYFFNVFHDRTEWDSVGEESPDQHAAWKEATVTAGQLLQVLMANFSPITIGGWKEQTNLLTRFT
jgi:hypothetical protein